MGLPSLSVKGSLKAQGKQVQSELDKYIPIQYIIKWFKERQSLIGLENRILMLIAQTGSGKSTTFPAEIYKEFIAGTKERIISLQPTVTTTITIAKDLITSGFFPYLEMGKNLGYSTGNNKLRAKEGGITYATLGTLLMQMKSMSDLDFITRYKFIIIDEAHKRTVDLEITILLLKALYERNKTNINLPFLIFTSATFEADVIADYFSLSHTTNIIFVAGEPTYPKEYFFTEKHRFANYLDEAAELVMTIHDGNLKDEPKTADILVFLPGMAEMKYLKNKLTKLQENHKSYFIILDIGKEDVSSQSYKNLAVLLPVNEIDERKLQFIKGGDEQLTKDDNQRRSEIIKGSSSKNAAIRKVILATEMMETGMTIDTLKYVIETGYFKEMTYDAVYNMTGLILKPVSQASATQRFGRVGRKSPGKVYALYSKEIYQTMSKEKFPEILTNDVSTEILTIISVLVENNPVDLKNLSDKTFDARAIDLLQPIPLESLKSAIEKCVSCGMIAFRSSDTVLGGKDNKKIVKSKITKDNDIVKGKNVKNKKENKTEDKSNKSNIFELQNYYLTATGKVANMIKLPIEHTRMILSGLAWNTSLLDLISIASYLLIDKRELEVYDRENRRNFPILWDKIISKTNILNDWERPSSLLIERILLASDFIRGIFLIEALLDIFDSKDMLKCHITLLKFCKEVNLSIDGVIEILKTRDTIINQCLATGIDVYSSERNKLNSITNIQEQFEHIDRIKLCIWEGFKMNMATFSNETLKYKIRHGNLQVPLPEIFNNEEMKFANKKNLGITWKTVPKHIIYDKIIVDSQTNGQNIHSVRFNYISSV
jgi:HrpA-like RNA helicase